MKKKHLVIILLFFIHSSYSQKVGLDLGAGVCFPSIGLKKTVPFIYSNTSSSISAKLNEVSIGHDFQLPFISVYYKTFNDFKLYGFFQYTEFGYLDFYSETYNVSYLYPSTYYYNDFSIKANPQFIYSAKDFGLGVQQLFFKKFRVGLLANAWLGYKDFKAENIGTYNQFDYTILNKTVNSFGNFMVAGAGIGVHYKNLSLTGNFFHNITRIDQSSEQYLHGYSGFCANLVFGIDKNLPLFKKKKMSSGRFSFSRSSKNNFFIELTQNAYSKSISKGESVLTYQKYSSFTVSHFSDSMTTYTDNTSDTLSTDIHAYDVLYFRASPKTVSFPSLTIGLSHKLSEKVSLLLKTGTETYQFRFDTITISFPDGIDNNITVWNILLSQGLKINNLFSLNKNTAFFTVMVNEKLQFVSEFAVDGAAAIYNPLYISGNVEFGFNRFHNSLAVGFERNMTPLTTSKINYQINSLYSIYFRLAHYF